MSAPHGRAGDLEMERGAKAAMPELQGPTSRNSRTAGRGNRSLRALAAAVLGGGTVAAALYLPGVTVEPDGAVDPSNPYPISFTISDANFIPLNKVNAYLVICYAIAAPVPPAPVCEPPFKTRKFKAAWRDHSLSGGRQFTIVLDDFLRFAPPAKFGGADISIIVEYQPWLLPLRQEKEFRFATEPRIDGKLDWVSSQVADETGSR
jgi:hypothetical protein